MRSMRFYFLYPLFLALPATSVSYAVATDTASQPISLFPRIVQLGPTSDAYFVVCHAQDCPPTSFKHLKISLDIERSDIQQGIHVERYKEVAEQSSNPIGKVEHATPIQITSEQKNSNKTKTLKKRKRHRPTCLKQTS